jgi:peptidoglycan/LPS O-acetylase OafA/YrhL
MNKAISSLVELRSTRAGLMDSASRYIPTLDGWRAMAIFAVIISHGKETLFGSLGHWNNPTLFSIAANGRLGVDLFFAISGFLITSRLVEEARRDGRFSLSRFYTRRIFRILPPYLLYLAVLGAAGFFGVLRVFPHEIQDCLLFIRNYTMYREGTYTNHFWSLAVEEHFYLLWPLLLMAAGVRRSVWVVPLLGCAIHGWRAIDVRYHVFAMVSPDTGVIFRTDTRIDALLWGCFAALMLPNFQEIKWRSVKWAWAVLASVILLVVLFSIPMQPLWIATLFPALVVSTVLFPETLAGRLLEWEPLRWVGRLSYSLYLWQTLFLQSPEGDDSFFHLPWLKSWPLNLVAIFGLGAASYYLLERPMIRLGHKSTAREQRHALVPLHEKSTA